MNNHLRLATVTGEEHGLINLLTNSVPVEDAFRNMKPEHKKQLEAEKKEDARIVKAEYFNSRGRHERLTKAYCKYAGDPIQIWHFIPNRVYEVPFGLVKEVNDKNKHIPKRSGLVAIDGELVKKDGSPTEFDMDGDWLHRFSAVGF